MSDWENASRAWFEFLVQVEEARKLLRCSLSSAWFRGAKNSNYDLLPSIYRTLRKPSDDNKKQINALEATFLDKTKRKEGLGKEIRRLNSLLRRFSQTGDFLSELLTRNRLDSLHSERAACASELDAINLEIRNYSALETGEYDSYIDFVFRSGEDDTSSWVTLAKMRHYGIPTRLLDWTESLIVAIYFATENYSVTLGENWKGDGGVVFGNAEGLPQACVWILNPYKLARVALKTNTLWSPGTEIKHDYFKSFFVDRNWKFEQPIPMYSPWKNPRIASQQGMFTVHGLDKKALNQQVSDDIVARVVIKPAAAIFAVKLMRTVFSLDRFTLFRDLDSLGNIVKSKYLP